MPERERIQKQKATTEKVKEVEDVQPNKTDEKLAEELDELLEEIDSVLEENDEELNSILDEIDGVLEVNAEQFVRDFVQKGGQ